MSLITINAHDLLQINLDIKDRITIIMGDSATGKTYLINTIDAITKNPGTIKVSGIPENRLVVCKSESEVANILNCKHSSMIFIDRYDNYSTESKKKIINMMKTLQYIWVIITRNPDFPNYGTSFESIVDLKRTEYGQKTLLELKQHI